MASKKVDAPKQKQDTKKTNLKSQPQNQKTNPIPIFKNPTESIIGKIIIWILIIGFIGSIVAGIITLLISQ